MYRCFNLIIVENLQICNVTILNAKKGIFLDKNDYNFFLFGVRLQISHQKFPENLL